MCTQKKNFIHIVVLVKIKFSFLYKKSASPVSVKIMFYQSLPMLAKRVFSCSWCFTKCYFIYTKSSKKSIQ